MKKSTLLLTFILFLACTMHAQNNISCTCIYYDEITHSSTFSVSSEEVTLVPSPSETWVTDVSKYKLEKDSLGRVSKLIRSDHTDNPRKEEITYVYDSANKLIREDISIVYSFKNSKSLLNNEQIVFQYDDKGRRTKKVHKLIFAPGDEVVLSECTYSY